MGSIPSCSNCEVQQSYPAPPAPLQSPPPGGGGGETVTSLFRQAISIAAVCVPHLSHTGSCIAFPLLPSVRWAEMKRVMHSFLVVLSASGPQLSLTGVSGQGAQRMYLHQQECALCGLHCVKVCKIHGATVQSVLFLYPEILHRSFGPPITSVLHESCWQSINANVASLVLGLLASIEGTPVCLEIPLQPPPPPGGDHHLATVSPPGGGGGRRLRATGGDFKGGAGYVPTTTGRVGEYGQAHGQRLLSSTRHVEAARVVWSVVVAPLPWHQFFGSNLAAFGKPVLKHVNWGNHLPTPTPHTPLLRGTPIVP